MQSSTVANFDYDVSHGWNIKIILALTLVTTIVLDAAVTILHSFKTPSDLRHVTHVVSFSLVALVCVVVIHTLRLWSTRPVEGMSMPYLRQQLVGAIVIAFSPNIVFIALFAYHHDNDFYAKFIKLHCLSHAAIVLWLYFGLYAYYAHVAAALWKNRGLNDPGGQRAQQTTLVVWVLAVIFGLVAVESTVLLCVGIAHDLGAAVPRKNSCYSNKCRPSRASFGRVERWVQAAGCSPSLAVQIWVT
ncbi:hypothetical protein CONLIGDRAFT_687723 [Coniochaeta ligniaria NRRL 30616]|uniref:Uncharacterized protein n=1 Tax=Coniochaeta ligniaria NRRL 30616 TaxID=1408157 RepID=A0A1J7I410_9PEZI|nr:hypothetical protein CONLIGDRAFT_687723 [Coniochaeta ligniaria NRRL 30616]